MIVTVGNEKFICNPLLECFSIANGEHIYIEKPTRLNLSNEEYALYKECLRIYNLFRNMHHPKNWKIFDNASVWATLSKNGKGHVWFGPETICLKRDLEKFKNLPIILMQEYSC